MKTGHLRVESTVMKKNLFLSLSMLFLYSCTVEYESATKTTVLNNSGVTVKLMMYGSRVYESDMEITILNGDEYVHTSDLHIGGGEPPILIRCDSIEFIFNNKKKSVMYKQLEGLVEDKHLLRSPFYESYVIEYKDKSEEYTYTITEEDFENAVPIEDALKGQKTWDGWRKQFYWTTIQRVIKL